MNVSNFLDNLGERAAAEDQRADSAAQRRQARQGTVLAARLAAIAVCHLRAIPNSSTFRAA